MEANAALRLSEEGALPAVGGGTSDEGFSDGDGDGPPLTLGAGTGEGTLDEVAELDAGSGGGVSFFSSP